MVIFIPYSRRWEVFRVVLSTSDIRKFSLLFLTIVLTKLGGVGLPGKGYSLIGRLTWLVKGLAAMCRSFNADMSCFLSFPSPPTVGTDSMWVPSSSSRLELCQTQYERSGKATLGKLYSLWKKVKVILKNP
ncbi:unnamed protein product [Prunus armeniaca]|uniref:Uncharacterized protein n=1 Tax=Prunus armeniaca TaxID=36596 RepID=A0A6J5TPA5_PRUAR|nr:unnamed protein product [Prunus armeniaca]